MAEGTQGSGKYKHPGKGRKRGRSQSRGRQLDIQAVDEVRSLLGDRPRQRDLLIEHLHLIQDAHGQLSAVHLGALAQEMKLSLAEGYEVATFYAHFDIAKEGEAPPRITVRVCDSLTCELMGARDLTAQITAAAGDGIRVVRAPCMGRCDCAPVAEVGHNHVVHATAETVNDAINNGHTHPKSSQYVDLDAYEAGSGYSLLRDCLVGKRSADDIISILEESSLRGFGGAGFPTGRKWKIVRAEPKPRLMAVNADEGEPGTFKDRFYLETDPHRFLEGMLIGAWVVEAADIYFYLRDEYPHIREILLKEIAALEEAGLSAHTKIHLRRGAGAYICGEESAMLESIEGKRGMPRHRPPFVAAVGLWNRPTLVNNVETLFWVRDIVEKGAEWFADQGRNGGKGMRSFSVSGRVKEPGVKLAPAGITVQELITEYCGGMAEGHVFKGYLPGGASGGILPAAMGNLPLEFGQLEKHGSFVGSHAVVVLSNADSMCDVTLNLMRFFEDESCGQCTPCRVGTEKAVKLMERNEWNTALLEELSQTMTDASICGLGQAAANPLRSLIKYFPEDMPGQGTDA